MKNLLSKRSFQLASAASHVVSFHFMDSALQEVHVPSQDPSKSQQLDYISASVTLRAGIFQGVDTRSTPYTRNGRREVLTLQSRFLAAFKEEKAPNPWVMEIEVADPSQFELGLDIVVKEKTSAATNALLFEKTWTWSDFMDEGSFSFRVNKVGRDYFVNSEDVSRR